MWVFFKGFTDLLLPSKFGEKIPDTFCFDDKRIPKLRAHILDVINLDLCIRLLKDFQNNRTDKSKSDSDCWTSITLGETSLTSINAELHWSILAIVDDAAGNNRWHQSCSNIALELLRSTPNDKDLSKLESQLQFHLSNPTSFIFQASETQVLAEFYPLLSDLVARYSSLTAVQLFLATASSQPLPCQVRVPQHTLSDVAKQMAHIGILHWRVWAPLAYLANPDQIDYVPQSSRSPQEWLDALENNSRNSQMQDSIFEIIPTGS
jgi:hypothetical protein